MPIFVTFYQDGGQSAFASGAHRAWSAGYSQQLEPVRHDPKQCAGSPEHDPQPAVVGSGVTSYGPHLGPQVGEVLTHFGTQVGNAFPGLPVDLLEHRNPGRHVVEGVIVTCFAVLSIVAMILGRETKGTDLPQ